MAEPGITAVLAVGWAVVLGLLARAVRSAAPGLRRWGLSSSVAPEGSVPPLVAQAVRSADLPGAAATWWLGGIGAAVAGGVVGLVVTGAAGLVVGPAIVLGSAGLVLGARSGRRAERVELAIPDLLEEVARALRAGLSLPQALGEAARVAPAPTGPALARAVEAAHHGAPVAEAVDAWAHDLGGEGAGLAADALVLADRLGGAPARTLDRVASTLRARLSVRAEARANAAQAKASAFVLVAVPPVFALGLAVADPRVGAVLTGTLPGVACVVGGLCLEAAGAWWMARLVRAEP